MDAVKFHTSHSAELSPTGPKLWETILRSWQVELSKSETSQFRSDLLFDRKLCACNLLTWGLNVVLRYLKSSDFCVAEILWTSNVPESSRCWQHHSNYQTITTRAVVSHFARHQCLIYDLGLQGENPPSIWKLIRLLYLITSDYISDRCAEFADAQSFTTRLYHLRSIQTTHCVFSITIVFKLNKCKSWGISCHPNIAQSAIIAEGPLQFFLCHISGKVTHVDLVVQIGLTITRHGDWFQLN